MTDHYYPNQKNLAGVSRLCGNHAIVQTHSRRRRRVDGVEPPRHRADALPHAGLGRAETGVRPDHGPALRANGSAWDLYGSGCGFKQLPRSVPVEKCVRVAAGGRGRGARARPALASVPALPSQGLAVVMTKGACSVDVPCVAGPDLRAGLRRTSAKHVVVVFGGNVAPCLSSLRNELATRSGPLYAGASPLRNAALPAGLEERTKLGVAPEHFDGVAVLSAELASYVASQATPPLLAGDGPAALGVWLAPFDVDRRPLRRWGDVGMCWFCSLVALMARKEGQRHRLDRAAQSRQSLLAEGNSPPRRRRIPAAVQ